MPGLISRADAKTAGLTRYFTGKPCPRGHIAERRVSGSGCAECDRVQARRWSAANPVKKREQDRRRNPEKKRSGRLMRDFGITLDQYNDILAGQGFGCQCCGAEVASTRGEKLAVDHHHASGQVRGLLCHNCNAGVIAGLEASMTPLQIWAAIKAAQNAGQTPSPHLVYLHEWHQRLALRKMGIVDPACPATFYMSK